MFNRRRAPLLAAIGVAVLALLVVLLLVLPKMSDVSAAEDTLDETRSETTTLQSEREALEDAQAQAPEYRAAIKEVEQRIPPVVDEGGLLLLLQNAATTAGLDVTTIAPGEPVFDPETGLSTIGVSVQATGTYFEIAEFMYEIETLPRAAKADGLTLNPEEQAGGIPTLTFSTNVLLFTTDASAGPGSAPGPTTGADVEGEEG